MPAPDVVIIGGGPAGLAAAGEAARASLTVTLIEQRAALGGAIFRQPSSGEVVALPRSRAAERLWRSLLAGIAQPKVKVRFSTSFLGVDGDGHVLIHDRAAQTVERLRPKAVIIACGAVERVRLRPGWDLPGVATAGGLQVMMKETGAAPRGRVLLAGSGPLLVALAAQMIRSGNPPLAVVEAGDPLSKPLAGLPLVGHPAILSEAVSYTMTLLRSRVRWLRGAHVERIERRGEVLQATVALRDGSREVIEADRIGLHDGIAENDIGLPDQAESASPIVIHAGDCREALGALGAILDGQRAGRRAAALVKNETVSMASLDKQLERARAVQRAIARLFEPVVTLPGAGELPDDTVLCRCEGRTVGDLKALLQQPGISGREVKHVGRFAMGSCQGRFCAANTTALMAELQAGGRRPEQQDLTGQRWPVRPTPIAAFVNAGPLDPAEDKEELS